MFYHLGKPLCNLPRTFFSFDLTSQIWALEVFIFSQRKRHKVLVKEI